MKVTKSTMTDDYHIICALLHHFPPAESYVSGAILKRYTHIVRFRIHIENTALQTSVSEWQIRQIFLVAFISHQIESLKRLP